MVDLLEEKEDVAFKSFVARTQAIMKQDGGGIQKDLETLASSSHHSKSG